MTNLLKSRLEFLARPSVRGALSRGLRGIEREALRTDAQGRLARTPHPRALGSALTHPHITTDYSESLPELITSPHHDAADVLSELDVIHRVVHAGLGSELLWSNSMPCELPEEDAIPIAWYGTSNIGMLKHVYRRGLALRYGRAMQCISGIHYNFSLSEEIWEGLRQLQKSPLSARDFQSEGYIALTRNFHRYSWLLMYLFGASPALPTSFLQGRAHELDTLADDTLYLPYATSLRMSDLGYQNKAQSGLMPACNSLEEYMRGLAGAVRQPYAPYEKLGLKRGDEWVQINTNVLQIENEYYATIRPKRVIERGERPLEALCERGVQYIEVRCMDVDPFEPVGISLPTARFLDAFLLYCAMSDSPVVDASQEAENGSNFATVVKMGRKPDLQLTRNGTALSLQSWAHELLDQIDHVAALLDMESDSTAHSQTMSLQRSRVESVALTLSARTLAGIRAADGSFHRFALETSREHAERFRSRELAHGEAERFAVLAEESLAQQQDMEQSDKVDFNRFIEDYRARTPSHLCG